MSKAKATVRLDDNYSLKFTTNAMAEVEERLDKNTSEILELFKDRKLSIKSVRILFWAGLLHQHTDEDDSYTLTVKQAGNLMDKYDFTDVLTKTMKSFSLAFGKSEEKGKNGQVTALNKE